MAQRPLLACLMAPSRLMDPRQTAYYGVVRCMHQVRDIALRSQLVTQQLPVW